MYMLREDYSGELILFYFDVKPFINEYEGIISVYSVCFCTKDVSGFSWAGSLEDICM